MHDISVTEAYFLYSIQEKGRLSGSDSRKAACLLAALLWEMSRAGHLTLSKDRIQLLPSSHFAVPWFSFLYEHIKAMNPASTEELLQDYASSWSDRHLNLVTSELGLSLEKQGLGTRAKLGLFHGRTFFYPRRTTVPGLQAELQVALLYENPVPADAAFLWTLLTRSHCTPSDLSPDLADALTRRAETAAWDPAFTSAMQILEQLFSPLRSRLLPD